MLLYDVMDDRRMRKFTMPPMVERVDRLCCSPSFICYAEEADQ